MRLRLHAGATADLEAAGDWYESQRPGLAVEFADEVARALETLAESPLLWPRWPASPDRLRVHRFVLSRFPFAIGYRVHPTEIVVLVVAHAKRRPLFWLSRG
ncbi:MAG: type II toxin-antitoxin system RelE/ParE family toxin [Deltaproteobacteria bacterium]|nr:type II toxin-antitoxin system RelE/ParE family toxin [Deltaproteobacteria bacterium]